MPNTISPEKLAAEFDCLMDRAGVAIPDDRRAGLLAAYGEHRIQLALLRGARTHVAEPSNVFSLAPRAVAP